MNFMHGSRRLTRALSLGLLAATLTFIAGCGKEAPKDAARPPIAVTTFMVTARDTPVTAIYVAQTQSSQAVNIQARVSGFLDKRVYTEGSVVKAGQVLFRMDQKPFQAQVDAAKAALQRNQAAAQVAKANLARTKPLAAQNALSQKDLDDATGQYEQAAAAVEQSQAQLESAQLDLSYTTISSPVTGVSSFAAVADGTYLDSKTGALTTVSVLSPMWINFSISENEMERIRMEVKKGTLRLPEGSRFTVEIELIDSTVFPYKGKITFADPSYNSQTGTFLIRASVDNPEGVLRPNQYVRARLKGAVRPNAILVPQRAVQQGAKGHFVWVVTKQNQAELRPIVVGDWYGDSWFVAEGLAASDQVIVDGTLRLAQGSAVKATPYVPKVDPRAAMQATAASNAAPASTASGGAPAAGGMARPTASAQTVPPGAAALAEAARRAVLVVHFAPASATLTPEETQAIKSSLARLKSADKPVAVTGFADSTGNHAANVELAKQRAVAVRSVLIEGGIPADRVRLAPPQDVTGGSGGNDSDARRVEIAIAG